MNSFAGPHEISSPLSVGLLEARSGDMKHCSLVDLGAPMLEPWVILIWVCVIVILVVGFRVYPRKPKPDYKAMAREAIVNDFPEFKVSHLLLKCGKSDQDKCEVHGLALDSDNKKVCLVAGGTPEVLVYQDIIEVQIHKSGAELHKQSRLAKFAGTPIGDAIVEAYDRFGGAKYERLKLFGITLPVEVEKDKFKHTLWGKLLLQNLKKKQADPEDVVIKLILNCPEKPFRTLSLLESDAPDAEAFKMAEREANMWFQVLKKVLEEADKSPPEPNVNFLCIADEITKMISLKDSGVISEEEFLAYKKRLIYAEA